MRSYGDAASGVLFRWIGPLFCVSLEVRSLTLVSRRQISLVLGFPFLFHEADITQPYFTVPELDSVGANASNDSRTLIGSLASIKLSRIIGHAISQLHSPREMPTLERDVCIMQLQQELDLWKLETPAFFLEPSSGLGGAQAFMQIPEFFLRCV